MNAKLILMRLKKNAVGSKAIPAEKRHYLLVCHHDPADTITAQPMFFSTAWSVGKALDVAAECFKVENRNNVPGALKLNLFRGMDGE